MDLINNNEFEVLDGSDFAHGADPSRREAVLNHPAHKGSDRIVVERIHGVWSVHPQSARHMPGWMVLGAEVFCAKKWGGRTSSQIDAHLLMTGGQQVMKVTCYFDDPDRPWTEGELEGTLDSWSIDWLPGKIIPSRIVTHGGKAHADEVLAVAVLLGRVRKAQKASSWINVQGDRIPREQIPFPEIRRWGPSRRELKEPSVFVVDVGGQYNPRRSNYDHHQDPSLPCAFHLVMNGADNRMSSREWQQALPWADAVSEWDTKGPTKFAESHGMSVAQLFAVQANPLGPALCAAFERGVTPALMEILADIGENILDTCEGYQARQKELTSRISIQEVRGLKVLVLAEKEGEENPQEGLNEWIRAREPDTAVTVTPNRRGGTSLFRVDDHPLVDFTRLEGVAGVIFTHKGGFIAVIEDPEEAERMIEQAIIR